MTTTVHCWAEGPQEEDGCPTTCMLPDMHDGPHEWMRDDEIVLRFRQDWEVIR